MQKNLEKYSRDIKLMNTVLTDGHEFKLNYLEHINYPPNSASTPFVDQIQKQQILATEEDGENFFLPYTGNGYIGLALQSTQGIYVNMQKSLSLNLRYNPLVQVYSDTLAKSGLYNFK